MDRLLQTTPASDVANNASYNKSALKRVTKEFSSKDVKRQVDALHKRIEKHFEGEDGRVLAGANSAMMAVWKRCEEEMVLQTEKINKILSQSYAGHALEYSTGDLEGAFKRHRAG